MNRNQLSLTRILAGKAFYKWGERNQINKCIEELFELLIELSNYKVVSEEEFPDKINKVRDEIADVLITTNQMAELFGFSKCMDRVDFKLSRLDRLIHDQREDTGNLPLGL